MDFRVHGQQEQTATTTERPIVPAGRRTVEIRKAEETTSKWRTSEDNPQGNVLALRMSDMNGSYKFIFDDISQTDGQRALSLMAALGRRPGGSVVSLKPADLVGQVLDVEVRHYTSKSTGKVSALVDAYIPAESNATPRTAPAEEVPADDIPF